VQLLSFINILTLKFLNTTGLGQELSGYCEWLWAGCPMVKIKGRVKNFQFSISARLPLGFTKPLVLRVPVASPGGKAAPPTIVDVLIHFHCVVPH
jgi:hypothetical protein